MAIDFEKLGVRLSIDKLRLEDEWVTHPQMVLNVGSLVSELQFFHDQAKDKLEKISAELDREIRETPSEYNLSKVTETAVTCTLQAQPEYLAAKRNLIETKRDLGEAQAILNALEHRKRALSMLVELWVKEYFSNPHPRARSEEAQEMEKRAVRNRGRRREEDEWDEKDGE